VTKGDVNINPEDLYLYLKTMSTLLARVVSKYGPSMQWHEIRTRSYLTWLDNELKPQTFCYPVLVTWKGCKSVVHELPELRHINNLPLMKERVKILNRELRSRK
jgi:hypothetical protein